MITNETINLIRTTISNIKEAGLDVVEIFTATLDDLQQYKEIEDQLGCPIKITFKALINGIYTKECESDKLEWFEVRGIEKDGLSVISKVCSYAECDFTCKFKDYKKTWWLREDKCE